MWRTIVLCTILGLAVARKIEYKNYEIYKFTATTEEELNIVRSWETNNDMFFWIEPTQVGNLVGLVINWNKLSTQSSFHEKINNFSNKWYMSGTIQDVIDRIGWRDFEFTNYHTLDEINNYLFKLSRLYEGKVQIVNGGRSYVNEIKGVKVSFKENNPGIFIEGGIHSHEWMSPATVMYILHQLLFSNDTEVRALAESHDWYIFPVFNPDGYEHAHDKARLWKKTRNPRRIGHCRGVDLNRNWPYKWMSEGASNNSCSRNYAGSAPLSEPESKSMSEYIKSISDKFYAYISFRGYSQLVTFSSTETDVEYNNLYNIGSFAIEALKERYGMKYKLEGEDAGNTIGFIRNTYKHLAYNYGFRDHYYYKFLLPSTHIIQTGEEIVDSLVALFKAAKKYGYPKKKNITME